MELKPNEVYAYYSRRARVYFKSSHFDNAIQDYTTAIQIESNHVNAYYKRGNAYKEKGDFDNAIKDYTKAIELKPDFVYAHNNRGEAWLHLQEWEKAKEDLTTARDLGMDIIAKFHSAFGSFENFERINGIPLPADIASMLTPPQA
ncbi:MAG: tetratricopeptide repeat protein [Candidatus Poribacteria bacterium]|nr:tetratricopeptide repeat protein [Candidatus Poribacteria bacterium]